MPGVVETVVGRMAGGLMGVLGRLPVAVQRRLAGPLETVDGVTVHPEVGMALRLLNAIPGPTFEELPLAKGRAQIDAEAAIFGSRTPVARVVDLDIPTAEGPVPGRLYSPYPAHGGRAVLVYAHGGGWVLGGLESADSVCRFLAAHAGVTVLSVDYRLAPEHPWPAAADDMLAAYRYAVAHAEEWGVPSGRVMIGGDSAGGNLTVVTAMRIRDDRRAGVEDLPTPALQVAFFPVTDLVGHHRSHDLFEDGYFLTMAQMRWYIDRYVPDAADRSHPYASPLLADDLTDLGPAYFGVAGFDPLRDEGIALAEAMRAAGNDVQLDVEARHIHAYVNATGVGRTAKAAMERACAAIRAVG